MTVSHQAAAAKAELLALHGEAQRARIERGVAQVASLWRPEDGDLAAFAREHFIADEARLEATLDRLEAVLEQIDGHFYEIVRELRRGSDLDLGPLLPVEANLAGLDPAAHIVEDLFQAKVAFVALLNFPLTTLEERLAAGESFSRRQWAEARLTNRFARRVPPEVQQRIARAGSDADLYIAQYNIWMHHLIDGQGRRLFPKGMRLISHWNLRDELKAQYAEKDGLERQRLIAQVMARIVTQTIPAAVIDNPRVDWNPFTNEVFVAPAETVESDAPEREAKADPAPEPNTRYAQWLAQFHAMREADPFSPSAPTAIARSFELGREMPEERVKALLEEVLASPLVPQVASLIEKRLGRPLEPHDLWYSGFRPRPKHTPQELDALTRQRYPDAEAFARDIPRILRALGFSEGKAQFLADHIKVDAARGAGHAMPALRRGDFPRLRTRIGKEGMDYKGYNIAVHELGHNVEQVLSLYHVDRTLLAGVPNNAFTEAMAFVFQSRDLELLGLASPDADSRRMQVLNTFWQTWEIAGVALVDVAVWHWLYEHPDATPAQLRDAVVELSQQVWNRYYAPVLGGEGTALLGIYSHLVGYPLYLCDYPLGHLIAMQIEEYLAGKAAVGPEIERMVTYGLVTPDLWMKHATGEPASAQALLRATEKALAGEAGGAKAGRRPKAR